MCHSMDVKKVSVQNSLGAISHSDALRGINVKLGYTYPPHQPQFRKVKYPTASLENEHSCLLSDKSFQDKTLQTFPRPQKKNYLRKLKRLNASSEDGVDSSRTGS